MAVSRSAAALSPLATAGSGTEASSVLRCTRALAVSPVAAYASARISSFSAQLTYGIRASAANRGGRHAKLEIESGSTITLKSSPPYPPSALRQKYAARRDRKSTRLNSSHGYISYAV